MGVLKRVRARRKAAPEPVEAEQQTEPAHHDSSREETERILDAIDEALEEQGLNDAVTAAEWTANYLQKGGQ